MEIREKDLVNYRAVISEATTAWRTANEITFKNRYGGRDVGSCILGDGVALNVIPIGCRKPRKKIIIPSRSVSFCQGSCHYEAKKDVAIKILDEAGLPAYYDYGFMD